MCAPLYWSSHQTPTTFQTTPKKTPMSQDTSPITPERRALLHKLIVDQHLETLTEELNKDKNNQTNFNVDQWYTINDQIPSSTGKGTTTVEGKTLLMTATQEGNIQMIRLLHKQFGADLNRLDGVQQSSVFYCVELKNYHKSETVSVMFYF